MKFTPVSTKISHPFVFRQQALRSWKDLEEVMGGVITLPKERFSASKLRRLQNPELLSKEEVSPAQVIVGSQESVAEVRQANPVIIREPLEPAIEVKLGCETRTLSQVLELARLEASIFGRGELPDTKVNLTAEEIAREQWPEVWAPLATAYGDDSNPKSHVARALGVSPDSLELSDLELGGHRSNRLSSIRLESKGIAFRGTQISLRQERRLASNWQSQDGRRKQASGREHVTLVCQEFSGDNPPIVPALSKLLPGSTGTGLSGVQARLLGSEFVETAGLKLEGGHIKGQTEFLRDPGEKRRFRSNHKPMPIECALNFRGKAGEKLYLEASFESGQPVGVSLEQHLPHPSGLICPSLKTAWAEALGESPGATLSRWRDEIGELDLGALDVLVTKEGFEVYSEIVGPGGKVGEVTEKRGDKAFRRLYLSLPSTELDQFPDQFRSRPAGLEGPELQAWAREWGELGDIDGVSVVEDREGAATSRREIVQYPGFNSVTREVSVGPEGAIKEKESGCFAPVEGRDHAAVVSVFQSGLGVAPSQLVSLFDSHGFRLKTDSRARWEHSDQKSYTIEGKYLVKGQPELLKVVQTVERQAGTLRVLAPELNSPGRFTRADAIRAVQASLELAELVKAEQVSMNLASRDYSYLNLQSWLQLGFTPTSEADAHSLRETLAGSRLPDQVKTDVDRLIRSEQPGAWEGVGELLATLPPGHEFSSGCLIDANLSFDLHSESDKNRAGENGGRTAR